MELSAELLTKTLALSAPERAALAHQLLLSLDPPDFNGDQEDLEKLFNERLDAVDRGEFSPRPWREALAEMRRALKEGRDQ